MSDDDLAARVAALELELRTLRQEQAGQHARVVATLLEYRQFVEGTRAYVAERLDQMWRITQDTVTFAQVQQQEITRLRTDLTELAGHSATAAQLADLYDVRKHDRPALKLRPFLASIGAERRYRAVVTARRRRQQTRGAADQTDESG